MQVIRCAIVNDTDLRIGKKFAVITIRLLDAQKIGLTSGQLGIGFGQGNKFDVSQSSSSLDMYRTNKSSADNSGCDLLCHCLTLL
jgi:hypothetical protein